jgi:esterase/lipase superfamily enzyme
VSTDDLAADGLYRQLRELDNPDPASRLRGRVLLRAKRWNADVQTFADALPEAGTGMIVFREGEKAEFEIVNGHDAAVWVTLVELGCDGKITLLLPWPGHANYTRGGMRLDPGATIRVAADHFGQREGLPLTLPEGFHQAAKLGLMTLKLLVTSASADFELLQQEAAAALEQLTRPPEGEPGMDWAVANLPLGVRRQVPMNWTVLVLSFGDHEADTEASLIRQHLARAGARGDLRVETARIERPADLFAALRKHDPVVVHFTGPGGELTAGGQAISPDQLGEIFAKAEASTECVLLNAFFSLERADALLDQVRCVMGTPGDDRDNREAAERFWMGFYQGLCQGDGYAAAFEHGRIAAGSAPEQAPRFATHDPDIFDAERGRPRNTAAATRAAFDFGVESAEAPLYPLWFGTNRAPVDPADPAKGFSSERGTALHYGTCRVAVPRSHKIGSVGSAWWKRLLTAEDDRLRLDWKALRLLAAEAFWADLSKALAERDAGQRMGLVVIHGYNVSFEAAALRAAQIGFDLQVPGVTAFFSWPSRARLAGYTADEATIQASEKHIAQFLLEFTRQSGVDEVHVIAHSMGNRGLLRAMQRILTEVGEATRVPFGQIVLAAPDEDQDVFAELSAAYSKVARRTTLYVSAKDRAVATSFLVHDAPRVGLTPPVTIVPGIDTVEVTNVDVSLLGHGYFAEARDLLHDIHNLLIADTPPASRMGLRPATTSDGRGYWVIGG